MNTILTLIPSILLIIGVCIARFGGNDKSPYIVLSIIGLNILYLLGIIIARLMKSVSGGVLIGAIIPTLYALIVIFLGKNGFLDTNIFLGFR